MRITAAMMILLMVTSLFVGCTGEDSDNITPNSAPTAQMSVEPDGSVQVGHEITFSGVGSFQPDGNPHTFSWSFGDGNTGSGLTIIHSYNQEGEYIAILTVSNGTYEDTVSATINIIDLPDYVKEPHAEIFNYVSDDCDGEQSTSGSSFILVWICDENRNLDDKIISTSRTSVILDGTNSSNGCEDESQCSNDNSLVRYIWDLDRGFDSDGDGITNNDNDLEGDLVIVEDMAVGVWDIRLTVEDSYGQRSFHDSRLYINQRAIWEDFDIIHPTSYSWELDISTYNRSNDFPRYIYSSLLHPEKLEDETEDCVNYDNCPQLIIKQETGGYTTSHWTENAECIEGICTLTTKTGTSVMRDNSEGMLNITLEHDDRDDLEEGRSVQVDFILEIRYR